MCIDHRDPFQTIAALPARDQHLNLLKLVLGEFTSDGCYVVLSIVLYEEIEVRFCLCLDG